MSDADKGKGGGTPPFHVLVTARFDSTRFPGTPLADLGGKPWGVRVCERARASGAERVCVATDDARIASAAHAHGFEALMTRAEHASGTDRIAEAAAQLGLADTQIVVNVQGDEPLLAASVIAQVAAALAASPDASMSTACHPIADPAEIFNPNVVKVVLDARGHALYFSRAPIPWARDAWRGGPGAPPPGLPCYRHAGLYAYRAAFLARYASLAPAPLEQFESLEQLRVLWHGERIAVAVSEREMPPGVDTPADLEAVRRLFARDMV